MASLQAAYCPVLSPLPPASSLPCEYHPPPNFGPLSYKDLEKDMDDVYRTGEFPTPQRTRPTEDEVLIGVMGATGTGKSTFINTVSGSVLGVSSGLVSCTNDVGIASFFLDGRRVTLLDTPGFDDTNKSDTDILKTIALYLTTSYEEGQKLAGIIYIHRISDVRMGGTSTRNFGMFRKLCGESSLKNVVILTNMWGNVDRELGEARERELATDNTFFKGVLEKGAKMVRHDGSLESARTVLRYFMNNKPVPLRIQREIVDEKKDILETAAGEEINKGLIEQNKRHEKEMAELLKEHRDALNAKDEETRLELETAKKELEARMLRSAEEQREWASNFREERQQFREMMQEMQANSARELKLLEDRYSKEMEMFQQQRQMDSAQAMEREAELRRQIDEARNRSGGGGGGCVVQ